MIYIKDINFEMTCRNWIHMISMLTCLNTWINIRNLSHNNKYPSIKKKIENKKKQSTL
jgi:hypothetical protein